jgi:hypothetical protein
MQVLKILDALLGRRAGYTPLLDVINAADTAV